MALYNNPYQYSFGVPGQMNQFQQQPVQMPAQPVQQQQNNNGILWVSGEVGAKSYLVAPGTSVLLMDSESEKFYIKSTDASGMPQPLRTFEYHEVGTQGQERFLTISAMKRFLTCRLKTMTSDVPLLRIARVHCLQLQWLHRHSSLLMRLIQHRSRHIRFLTRTHFTDVDAILDAIADNFISRVSFD